MKSKRHQAILDLVTERAIHTQHELATALAERGMGTTQATVSRDIQELRLVRTPDGYQPPPQAVAVFRDHVTDVQVVEFVAVVRTGPGTASLVAWHIDNAAIPGVAGTVAGDDTIIAILGSRAAAESLRRLLLGHA